MSVNIGHRVTDKGEPDSKYFRQQFAHKSYHQSGVRAQGYREVDPVWALSWEIVSEAREVVAETFSRFCFDYLQAQGQVRSTCCKIAWMPTLLKAK